MSSRLDKAIPAVKAAADIAEVIGGSLKLIPTGARFKALCPFHDDHNPSLIVSPDRQTFKCWSCGAGGDVFDFVMRMERVEFPEALAILAERFRVHLDLPGPRDDRADSASRSSLIGVHSWAEKIFRSLLLRTPEAIQYLGLRGISPEWAERFGLGYAHEEKDWLIRQASKEGIPVDLLESSGLVVRTQSGIVVDRFRGRIMFPVRDIQGRTIAFGGRILPRIEAAASSQGTRLAKYTNSPETSIFQKRRSLYAIDMARDASRAAGWVAVMEGYTDVIAAHAHGITSAVATLGTALGIDHLTQIRRLADRAVLIFDGDDAGLKAADRSIEIFLSQSLDVRIVALPDSVDPADFLADLGEEALRSMISRSPDPIEYAIRRASEKYQVSSVDGARKAAEWVVSLIASATDHSVMGSSVAVAKAIDVLSQKLRIPVEDLRRTLGRYRRASRTPGASPQPQEAPSDPVDLEIARLLVLEPGAIMALVGRVSPDSIEDSRLRSIVSACFEIHEEGGEVDLGSVMSRLEDPGQRSVAAGLATPIDPSPIPDRYTPGTIEDRIQGVLRRLQERQAKVRTIRLRSDLDSIDREKEPEAYRRAWRAFLGSMVPPG